MSAAISSPLSENPFNLLKVSTRDARHSIIDAAETAALTSDAQIAQNARATLTNPRKRLAAEIAWLPGIAPARATGFLAELASGSTLPDGVTGLARVNLGSHLIALETPTSAERCRHLVEAIMSSFEQLSANSIVRQINEDREIAGLPLVSDLGALNTALADLRRQWVHGVIEMVDRSPPDVFRSAFYEVFDTAPHNDLSDDIADALALGMKAFLDAETSSAEQLCAKMLELAPRASHALRPLLEKLDELLANWEQTTRPLQVNAAARGIEHQESARLASMVRDTAVSLVNEHGLLEPAEWLTQSIDRHFRVMAAVAERAEEDTQALARLTADSAQRQADDEAFIARMRYSAEIGMLFKKRVSMDDKQITFEGATVNFAEATGLSWGAIMNSTNGVHTGTQYSVVVRDENKVVRIAPKTERVYSDLIERLFATAGWLITLNIIRDVAAGGTVPFGSAVVADEYIQFSCATSWLKTETIRLPWAEAQIWSHNGHCCIGRSVDDRAKVELSYMNVYNVHMLENIVRTVFKRGGTRLSDFLQTST